jgi:acyl-CoA thioester hydrolase
MQDRDYVHRVEVRYRDIDTQGIVNNGVFPSYLTECRTGYLEELLDLTIEEVQDIVTARLEIDYLAPVERGEDLVIHLRCAAVGTSSFTLEYEIRADGELAIRARSVHAMIDPASRDSRPIPDEMRAELEGS